MLLRHRRVLVTGSHGFLGKHVCKALEAKEALVRTCRRWDYNLTYHAECGRLMQDTTPDVVIHLAAVVGGIGYNQDHPVEMIVDNSLMGLNMLDQAYKFGASKFVGVGSVCSYPKFCPVPFQVESLFDGRPESSNAPYGAAKKLLLEASWAYRQQYGFNAIHLIPTNLMGPGDNFNEGSSHVIPALIRRFMAAADNGDESVVVWGTGQASREFLYVEDAAEAIVKAAEEYDGAEPVNLGSGQELPIHKLVTMIAEHVGFKGRIVWDDSKPDGQPRRCLDTSRAKSEFGWTAKTSIDEGLKRTVAWWREQVAATREAATA